MFWAGCYNYVLDIKYRVYVRDVVKLSWSRVKILEVKYLYKSQVLVLGICLCLSETHWIWSLGLCSFRGKWACGQPDVNLPFTNESLRVHPAHNPFPGAALVLGQASGKRGQVQSL